MTGDEMRVDVLVLGGGLAGLRAAAAAALAGSSVAVASRGRVGAGGCSVRASGGFAAALAPGDSSAEHYADTLAGGYGIADRRQLSELTERSAEMLEALSAVIEGFETRDRRLAPRAAPVHGFPRSVQYERGMPALLRHLREDLRQQGVVLLDDHRVVGLQGEPGRLIGGAWLRRTDGSLVPLRAGSTVVALGGCGQLFPVTSNGPDATGDAFALALAAGAELRDMEFIQFTPTAFAAPDSIRGRTIVGTLLTLPGVTLTNARGERFMQRYDSGRLEQSDRAILARAIHQEVAAGRGSPGGGVYLDLRRVDAVELDRHRPGFHEFCREAGLDPGVRLLETAPSAHTCLGGLVADTERRVLPGLYAAGEAVGGVHGANRLSSNSLADALVGGWLAGEQAAHDAQGVEPAEPGPAPELPGDGEVDALQATARLRRLMGSAAGVVREGGRLDKALIELTSLQEQTETMRRKGVVNVDHWLDLVSLMETGRAVLTASKARTESRGAHHRSDYPELDDKHWRGNLFLTRRGGSIRHHFVPQIDDI